MPHQSIETPSRSRRADIQALRAIAVGLVVVFHFFPAALPGGYIGVDVFFVISGFLITGLLSRELQRSGRVELAPFYARRAKRLLPAALVTTGVTVALSLLLMGPVRAATTLVDATWSSAFLANVRFGTAEVGYFATTDPSPFLHYWSLSVEEQFYLLWPLTLIGGAWVARRRRGALFALVAGVTLVSFVLGIILTNSAWQHGYYSLVTRAWELGAGGMLAFAVPWLNGVAARVRAGVASLGVAFIAWGALNLTGATPFPGVAALIPVIGAVLVIGGGVAGNGPVAWLDKVPGVRLVGDASYSIYLWHWPVVVLGVLVVGDGAWAKLGLMVLSVGVGVMSYHLVERPFMRTRPSSTRRTVASGIGGSASIAVACAALVTVLPGSGGTPTVERGPIEGAVSVRGHRIEVSRGDVARPPTVPSNLKVPLAGVVDDLAVVFTNGCFQGVAEKCEGGDLDGTVHVVLAGDSQAGQLWPALDILGRERGWRLTMVGKNGCPLAHVPVSVGATAEEWPECDAWQKSAEAAVQGMDADVVVYANHARGYRSKVSVKDDFESRWSQGSGSVLRGLTSRSPVLALGIFPTLGVDPVTCLSENLDDTAGCDVLVDDVFDPKVAGLVESLAEASGAYFLDPRDFLCSDTCSLIDGDVVVYRDATHLSASYAEALAPVIGAAVEAALSGPVINAPGASQ